MLYCMLTKRQIRNSLREAEMHTEGKYFRHKYYERMRSVFRKRKGKLESALRYARKLIGLGKLQRLKPGSSSEHNVLQKGFLKRKRYQKIQRYSKLIILSM